MYSIKGLSFIQGIPAYHIKDVNSIITAIISNDMIIIRLSKRVVQIKENN